MTTPILSDRAIDLFNAFMDEAGIVTVAERHDCLNAHRSDQWLALFKSQGYAQGMDVWDIIGGKEILNERLMMQLPTSGGKTDAVLAER